MRKRAARHGLTLAIVAAAAAVAAGCGSSGSSARATARATGTTSAVAGAARPAGSWADPNGDLANTRDVAGARISAANVAQLKEAWTYRLPAAAAKNLEDTGSLAAAPVVVNGVVYLQDLYANVYAISLATGKLKWEYAVNVAEKTGPGPDGVAVAAGVVYGTTPTTVFALNAATGAVLWTDKHLLASGQGTFEIQPAVAAGRVYLASAYGAAPGGGVLLALDASTGRKLWSFSTVTGGQPAGVSSLGLGSGGAWETPLVAADGSVTFGIGNPYQTLGGAISHPAADLYTDSEVNLDAATGRLRWYYQAEPNDFRDWDIQLSPISATAGGVPAIISGGKMGDVYAFNAATGALLWKTPVGVHNGHDNDSRLLLEHKLKITLPYTYEPGPLGGVLTDMAVADGSVYVATIDLPFTFTKLTSVNGTPASTKAAGEIDALNLATGKVEWRAMVASLPLGAATVSDDLVFTTLLSGELIALNRSTGAIVYQAKLPAAANSPIAVTSNAILVPAGGPGAAANDNAQLVAYSI
ncbi:MAG TPA: PQQ-binding-like beta-propeller repeat protein [Trebonia sp.]|nr:PQQ-binding-like beta-propeller repeat protein [Trebonia sp.]